MSSLLVPVSLVEKILPHPNADALELAQVLGWQTVVKKGAYREGEKVVFFPPDTVLPERLVDEFGIANYVSKGRIRQARLRGEPSFGLVIKAERDEWVVGQNVADYFGATKYEPPLRPTAGDAEESHPLFADYTDIENMRNYPDIFQEGEPVVLTEKIHGTQCRIAVIDGEVMAGSKDVRRKRPDDCALKNSIYWYPYSLPAVRNLLIDLSQSHRQVVLYGEVYGSKIQSLNYGQVGSFGFRVFDLLLDGKYVPWQELREHCVNAGIEMVPEIATIPFNLADIKQYSEGKTLLMNEKAHIREGVVVKPLQERRDPKIGRCVLKYVGDQYLFGKQSDYAE